MKHFLTVKGISKSFSNANVLTDCSFTAEKGELISLLGESGSGKTTLLRIIAGFENPDAGEVNMNGRLLCNANYAMMPEHRYVGLVFQDYALFPHLNVRKNIELGMKTNLKASIFLNMVGLEGLEKRKPHELSGGQQQRVAIARSLAASPQLLLLDEPFSNIDESLKFNFRRELRELLKSQDIPSVFVTHDTKDALAIADKIIILKDGEVRQIGTPEDIYLRPADTYVAGLLGTFNVVSEESSMANIIRSEHTRIIAGSEYQVTSSMYQGRSYLVHLQRNNIHYNVSSDTPLNIGSLVGLQFPEDHILTVLKR
jgi:iron(III) transport system ATP-binding protein